MPTEKDIQRHNLLVRVAKMYYLHGKTHQAIADELGASRVKVTRLLQEAAERGVVEIKIQDPIGVASRLEEELCDRFQLEACRIAPSAENEAELHDTLGRFAVEYISQRLRDGMTIGIGWGRTLDAMIPHLSPSKQRNLTLVSLTGGLAANPNQPNPYDVASAAAKKLGAALHYPLAPAIVADQAAKEMLMKDDTVQKTLALWKKLDMALVSIGNLAVNTNIFYTFPHPAKMVKALRRQGAVGDLLMNLLDRDGHVLVTEFSERLIRIDFEQLRRTTVIGVSGGASKVEAILAALRTGVLRVLVTDEQTAGLILQKGV